MPNWLSYKGLEVPNASPDDDAGLKLKNDLMALADRFGPIEATVATAGALPTNVYNNGIGGVGATLTATSNGALTIDSHAVQIGDTVVVNNEFTPANNGVYVVTAAGNSTHKYVLTRHPSLSSAAQFAAGTMVLVGSAGTLNANTTLMCRPASPINVGSTAIVFGWSDSGGNLTASYAHAEGRTTASGYLSHAEGGYGGEASGDYSHAEGFGSIASGPNSHAQGSFTTSGPGSGNHAEGNGTTASGFYCHAEGQGSTASGYVSHAEGSDTTASGSGGSHAEGSGTTAYGMAAHAEGVNSVAEGYVSHAEGGITTASSYYCHAEGCQSVASATASHSEGGFTTASGYYSHAEGYYGTASGKGSHAEGAYTTASGYYSHAEGRTCTAGGDYGHAGGFYGVASLRGQWARANGVFSAGGDAQESSIVLRNTTTNNTATKLSTDGTAAGSSNSYVLPGSQSLALEITVCARQSGGSNRAVFSRRVLATNNGGTITVDSTQTPVADAGTGGGGAPPTGWSVSIVSDSAHAAVAVQVQGPSATTINWVARIHAVHCGG